MSRFVKIILPFLILLSVFFITSHVSAQSTAGGNNSSPDLVGKFIPKCVIDPPTGFAGNEGECRSISIFVILLLNIANYLFSIVGALALLFFIYGGFVLILSQGSSEQTQKGKDIIIAAVIGLVVVFSAYILVRFLGEALDLDKAYRLV
jgi:amino acid transporter